MPEVMGVADRMVVMHEGHVSGILDRSEFSQELIMKYATSHEVEAKKRIRRGNQNERENKETLI